MVTPPNPIQPITEFIRHPATVYARNEPFGYPRAFQITGEEFLAYAIDDKNSTLPHKYINALANAKRAIDCQIETILKVYGYLEFAKQSRDFKSFSGKQKVLAKIGISPKAILTKQNKLRNVMEHEFLKPSKQEVEEAIDVADLYVNATKNYLRDFTPYFEMDNEILGEKICFHFNTTQKILHIRIYRIEYDAIADYKSNYQVVVAEPRFQHTYSFEHPGYEELLKFFADSTQKLRR